MPAHRRDRFRSVEVALWLSSLGTAMPKLSALLMDHFCAPRNAGAIEEPDLEGFSSQYRHGPFVRLTAIVEGDRIVCAKFQTFGCGVAIGLCSFLTDWMTSRCIAECAALSPTVLATMVGELPEEKRFCINLAIEALQHALADVPHPPQGS